MANQHSVFFSRVAFSFLVVSAISLGVPANSVAQIRWMFPRMLRLLLSRTEALCNEIELLRKEYDDRYETSQLSRVLLERNFNENNIRWSRRYLDDWGSWIVTDWSTGKKIYNSFIKDLQTPREMFDNPKSEDKKLFDYVNEQTRMHRLKQAHRLMGELFVKGSRHFPNRPLAWTPGTHRNSKIKLIETRLTSGR